MSSIANTSAAGPTPRVKFWGLGGTCDRCAEAYPVAPGGEMFIGVDDPEIFICAWCAAFYEYGQSN
jgi:hypothetical protein